MFYELYMMVDKNDFLYILLLAWMLSPLLFVPWWIGLRIRNRKLKEELAELAADNYVLKQSLSKYAGQKESPREALEVETFDVSAEAARTTGTAGTAGTAVTAGDAVIGPITVIDTATDIDIADIDAVFDLGRKKRRLNFANAALLAGAAIIIFSMAMLTPVLFSFLSSFASDAFGAAAESYYFIFAAATMLSFPVVLFIFSSVAGRALRAPKLGKFFYSVGCLALLGALLLIRNLDLLRTFEGVGYLMTAGVFGALLSAALWGAARYACKVYARVSLASLSLTAVCLSLHFADVDPEFFVFGVAAYSALLVFLRKPLLRKRSERFGAVQSVFSGFAAVNAALLSPVALFSSGVGSGWMAFASYALFAGAFLYIAGKSKTGFLGALLFAAFVAAVLCRNVSLSAGGLSFVATAAAVALTAMSLVRPAGAVFQRAFGTLSRYAVIPAAVVGALASIAEYGLAFDPVVPASLAALAINTAFIIVRDNGFRFRLPDGARGDILCLPLSALLILFANAVVGLVFDSCDVYDTAPRALAAGIGIFAVAAALKLPGRNAFNTAFSSAVLMFGMVVAAAVAWGAAVAADYPSRVDDPICVVVAIAAYCMLNAFIKTWSVWNRQYFSAGLILCVFVAHIVSERLFPYLSIPERRQIAGLCLPSLVAAAALFVGVYKPNFRFGREARYIGHISLALLAFEAAYIFIGTATSSFLAEGYISAIYAVPYAAILALALFFAYRDRFMVPVMLPFLMVYPTLHAAGFLLPYTIDLRIMALVFAASLTVSRLAHKKVADGRYLDVLTFTSWAFPIFPMMFGGAGWRCLSFIFAGLYFLNFIGRLKTDRAHKPLMTLACACAALAWYFQPLLSIPQRLQYGYTAAGVLLFFHCVRFVWKRGTANALFHVALSAFAFVAAIRIMINAPGGLVWHDAADYAVLLALALFFAYREKFTIPAALPLLTLFPVLSTVFNFSPGLWKVLGWFMPSAAFALAASLVVSRLAHRKAASGRFFDAPAAAFLPGLVYYAANCGQYSVNGSEYWLWSAWLFLGAFFLNFIDRLKTGWARRLFMTAACLSAVFAWGGQPFFALPIQFQAEYEAAGVVLFLVGMRFVWKSSPAVVDMLAFVAACFCVLTMSFQAARGEYLSDTLTVMAAVLIMLALALKYKRKKWFLLSVTSALLMMLFMGWDVRSAMLWWAYLAVMGVVLIVAGVRAEMRRRGGGEAGAGVGAKEERVGEGSAFLAGWRW